MLHVDLFSVYLAVIASGLALSLVWLVVARTFPTLYAARYWFGGALAAGVGSALSLWRGAVDPMVPIVLGNGMILIGSGLGWAGVRELNRRSAPVGGLVDRAPGPACSAPTHHGLSRAAERIASSEAIGAIGSVPLSEGIDVP